MSTADLPHRISSVETEVARLRHQTPSRIGESSVAPVEIIIIAGQSFGSFGPVGSEVEYFGIKKYSGILGSITTQTYDPGTCDPTTGAETALPSISPYTWPDGLGYGNMIQDGVYTRVMVVNDTSVQEFFPDGSPKPPNQHSVSETCLMGSDDSDPTWTPGGQNQTVICKGTIAVSLADGSTIDAWVPAF